MNELVFMWCLAIILTLLLVAFLAWFEHINRNWWKKKYWSYIGFGLWYSVMGIMVVMIGIPMLIANIQLYFEDLPYRDDLEIIKDINPLIINQIDYYNVNQWTGTIWFVDKESCERLVWYYPAKHLSQWVLSISDPEKKCTICVEENVSVGRCKFWVRSYNGFDEDRFRLNQLKRGLIEVQK